MVGGFGCSWSPGFSSSGDEVRTSLDAHLAIICLAASPWDCQAMTATPTHATNRKPVKARTALVPIDGRSPVTSTSRTVAARNVISTSGTVELPGRSDPARACGFVGWRKVRASLESSSSVGATWTTSGATTRTSCGSSVCFRFCVECIGAPYSLPCHRIGGSRIYGRSTTFLPTLHSGLTKARRYDEEYGAAYGSSIRELGLGRST